MSSDESCCSERETFETSPASSVVVFCEVSDLPTLADGVLVDCGCGGTGGSPPCDLSAVSNLDTKSESKNEEEEYREGFVLKLLHA